MKPYLGDSDLTLYQGDALETLRTLPDASVDCCVTSPPYWGLRDYGTPGQLGLEATPDEYVAQMVAVFREVRRVLAAHGTCWLNLGDSYMARQFGWNTSDDRSWAAYHREAGDEREKAPRTGHPMEGSNAMARATGLKPKDLVGVPWRTAFALQADGWWLRSEIIWAKKNCMPESVTDRPTKAHEQIFLLTKAPRYYFDTEAVREPHNEFWKAKDDRHPHNPIQANPDSPIRHQHQRGGALGFSPAGRNVRSVWHIATQPYPDAHFATFPEELARRCILAGCPTGGVVLDPFAGSGTVGVVARKHERRSVLIELNEAYCELIKKRTQQLSLFA